MNSFFLHCLNAQLLKFLVEDLTEIHNDGFMNLLPQMSTEHLYERNLQCRNLAMEEDAGEIELNLEADVDVRSVDLRKVSNYILSERGWGYLLVGDHQSVKRRFGIWFKPDRWALVSFLNFIDSSKPELWSTTRS